MIHEVHVSLTLTIASTQNLRNIVSIESYLELNTMTYALVLSMKLDAFCAVFHSMKVITTWLSYDCNVCEESFQMISNSMCKHVHVL